MASFAAVTDQAKQDWLNGLHQPSDSYFCALYGASAALGAATAVYTNTGEISGAGYTAGGQALTGFTVGINGNVAFVSWSNVSWAGSTLSGVVTCLIYNATRGNHALAVITFPSITTNGGTLTIVFPTGMGQETITIN
jgi:hypothetical protein